jgi:hypothetical protein
LSIAGHVARIEVRCIQGFGGETRGKDRLDDNIKMGLQEVRWRGMGRIALAQDRDRGQVLVNAVTCVS